MGGTDQTVFVVPSGAHVEHDAGRKGHARAALHGRSPTGSQGPRMSGQATPSLRASSPEADHARSAFRRGTCMQPPSSAMNCPSRGHRRLLHGSWCLRRTVRASALSRHVRLGWLIVRPARLAIRSSRLDVPESRLLPARCSREPAGRVAPGPDGDA
jgi:hypothetical protein